MSVVECLGLGGCQVVEVVVGPVIVEEVDPFEGGDLDSGEVAPGSVAWICSVLNDPIVVSASALSTASPTLPTDGSIPASSSRLWTSASLTSG